MEDIFRNRKRSRQLINFSGCELKVNKLLTDIDFAGEYKNRLFVFGECKLSGAEMPRGQELYFERVVDAIHNNQKRQCAVCLVATHNTPVEKDIMLKDCIVVKYRLDGVWCEPKEAKTVKWYLDYFYDKYVEGKL